MKAVVETFKNNETLQNNLSRFLNTWKREHLGRHIVSITSHLAKHGETCKANAAWVVYTFFYWEEGLRYA